MSLTSVRFFSACVSALCVCSATAMDAAAAPERIYRCGHEYTNTPANPSACEVVQGQTITLIQGIRPYGAAAGGPAPAATKRTKTALSSAESAPSLGATSPEPVDTKVRDAQRRSILVAELQQTRERHAQLVAEYNAGEPEKIGGEARNHQKYLDRLASLKAGIARAERDMDSLQRELSRLPSTQVAQP